MPLPTDNDSASAAAARKKVITSVIIGAVILHLIGGAAAGLFIVARYFAPPPATFEVRKDVRLPAKEREHKMNMAEFDAATPKPSFTDKLASMRPTDFALPDLPKVDMDQMLPLDPSEIIADQVSSIVGEAGLGMGGAGGGEGSGGLGGGSSFMGIETKGKRILFLFDVSGSVVRKSENSGVPMSKIREETVKFLEGLGINARFGMVQFVRNYKAFQPELVSATDPNKEAAIAWINSQWSESGMMGTSGRGVTHRLPNGIEMVLTDAFKWEPDVIYIVSDGSFWKSMPGSGQEKVDYRELRRLISDLQKELPRPAEIHFVGFEMRDDEKRELGSIVRANNGRLREIGKD